MAVRGIPTGIFDASSIQIQDDDSSLFNELHIFITNPQDGADNEIIEFSPQLPESSISIGPSLEPGGEILYSVMFLDGGANRDRVNETISQIRYLNRAQNITVAPPRIICLTITDFQIASERACVTITIAPPNNFNPVFEETLYIADPQTENTPAPRSILDVTAIDNDLSAPNNVIQSYSLENYQNFFRIDTDGTIETVVPLDAETQAEYLINVSAVDGGIPPQTGYTTVLLRVLDVNDNPAFVNQMEPAIHFIHGGPTSIGPAISIDDPDIDSTMIDRISIELIPNKLDRFLCQDVSLEKFEPELVPQSIDLLDLTTFQQDQPELNNVANFSPITLGARECRAWELRRGSTTAESDGYGRIPRSSLPPDFAVGDFTLSFSLVQSGEGYVILIPDQNDPSLPPNMVEHQFAIWIDHDQLIFYYTTTNSTYDFVEFPNEAAEADFGELFNPSSPVTHYFTVIVRSSQREVEVYADCEYIGHYELPGPVLTPSNDIDVFIGQSRPRSTSNGRFAGVISDLYYYSTALTANQVNTLGMCDRKEIIRLPPLPGSVRATAQEDTRLVIEPTSGVIPVDDAISVLRGITYENTFYSPILDPDRQLIFIVREEPGFEGITEGFITLNDVDTASTVTG